MSGNGWLTNVPPFPPEYRASGLLLHVTSLPSPYGVGDLGSSAFSWIDRLHDAGLAWWQALPLGPTGYGNSPYQSMSSFAGNELLISPGSLIGTGCYSRAMHRLTSRRTGLTTILLSHSNSDCSKQHGQISKPGGPVPEISRLPTTSSAPDRRIGWKTTFCSGH